MLEQLRRLDPAAHVPDQDLDTRARADLQRLIARPVAVSPAGRPRLWRPVVALVAATVLAALAVVAGVPGSMLRPDLAYAATPPLRGYEIAAGSDASDELRALQQRVKALAQTPRGAPEPISVVRTESWSLSSRIDDGEVVRSAVIPELSERRRNPDGSGSLRVVAGKPQFPGEDYRRAWQIDGKPAREGTVVRDEAFGPGEFQSLFPAPLAEDPDVLLSQLSQAHPIDELGTVELLVAISDLYQEQTPTPAVRAALLDLLAQRRDVLALGEATDRAGRTGLAVAVDSDYSGLPTRYIHIYNRDDGRLLATEQVLTERAGMLKVPVPSIKSYVVFGARG